MIFKTKNEFVSPSKSKNYNLSVKVNHFMHILKLFDVTIIVITCSCYVVYHHYYFCCCSVVDKKKCEYVKLVKKRGSAFFFCSLFAHFCSTQCTFEECLREKMFEKIKDIFCWWKILATSFYCYA